MKRFFLILSLTSLVLFGVLSKYEDRKALRDLDFAVTVKVQEKIDRSAHLRMASIVGNIMEGATYAATPAVTSIVILLMTGYAVYDWKKKQFHWKAVWIPIGFFLIVLVEIYAKSIVHHPSPPFSMIKHPTTIFPANYVNEQFSYPSGHAARALYIGIIALFLSSKKRRLMVGMAMAVYVLLVGISRIYLGEHWFSDVVGGLLLGAAAVSGFAL